MRERTNSWEFPVILKYHLSVRLMYPFVGIGYSPRVINGTDVSSGARGYTPFYNKRTAASYPLTHGVVFSAGVSVGAGHLRFTPEVRYTNWTTSYVNAGFANGRWYSTQNEALIVVGTRWR